MQYTTAVKALEKGGVEDAATEALAKVVDRVKATGKKSTIIVEITVEAAGVEKGAKDQIIDKVWLSASVKTKLAALPKKNTLLFIKDDTTELSTKPAQAEIPGVRNSA